MSTWLAPLLFGTSLLAQPPEVRLPDESTGIDGIARTLISVFDQADIIALGETHQCAFGSIDHPQLLENTIGTTLSALPALSAISTC